MRWQSLRRFVGGLAFGLSILSTQPSAAESICFKKSGFPPQGLQPVVSFKKLSDNRIRLEFLLKSSIGEKDIYDAELEIFYGVSSDFKWSNESIFQAGYELFSSIPLADSELKGVQKEAEIYLTKKFSPTVLHLFLYPSSTENRHFCPVSYTLVLHPNDSSSEEKAMQLVVDE